MIKDNILRLQDDISLICQRLGRSPNEITIVGVTKYADVPAIEEALKAGILHVGENKVQEALKKFQSLTAKKITRHMIGHLQTNKVKDALKIFDCIQSVDSLKLARAIDKGAAQLNRPFDILIQVNTSGERQKFGVAAGEAINLIDKILHLDYVRIRGLMTVGPLTDDQNAVRLCFRLLRELKNQIQGAFGQSEKITMEYLSMGMSSDYAIAVEEGSNMVRVGTKIFKNA